MAAKSISTAGFTGSREMGTRAKNSWYTLHDGPVAVGTFGCWKRGINEKWCERDGNLSQAEIASVCASGGRKLQRCHEKAREAIGRKRRGE